jgi:hypothetical protein
MDPWSSPVLQSPAMVNEFVLEGWPRTLDDSRPADAMEAATGSRPNAEVTMRSTQMINAPTTQTPSAAILDLKLEVVVIPRARR